VAAGRTTHDMQLMAQAATQVHSAGEQILGIQNNMNSSHETMMAGWSGTAASAYTNAFTAFNADFTKVLNALNNLGEKLKAAGVNYTVVEEANQTSANKISGILNG
jgi:WXG100 family type VII secretion target